MQALPASWASTLATSRPRVLGEQELAALEGIEGLVSVSNEGQAHLGFLRVWHGASLSTVDSASILLRDLVNREVRHVDVGAETRLEWRTNTPKLVPHDAAEERMVLDLGCTTVLATFTADTVLRITQEAVNLQLAC